MPTVIANEEDLVWVEVWMRDGIPSLGINPLTVDEIVRAREKLQATIGEADWPRKMIHVNIQPFASRKRGGFLAREPEGPRPDLEDFLPAISAGILVEAGKLTHDEACKVTGWEVRQ